RPAHDHALPPAVAMHPTAPAASMYRPAPRRHCNTAADRRARRLAPFDTAARPPAGAAAARRPGHPVRTVYVGVDYPGCCRDPARPHALRSGLVATTGAAPATPATTATTLARAGHRQRHVGIILNIRPPLRQFRLDRAGFGAQ